MRNMDSLSQNRLEIKKKKEPVLTTRKFVAHFLQFCNKEPIQVVCVRIISSCQLHGWVEPMLLKTAKEIILKVC